MKKKLALIVPKSVYFSCNEEVSNFFSETNKVTASNILMPQQYSYWSGASLGLLILAAMTPAEFEIDFIDENYEEINFNVRYDLVAITAITQQATRAYEIATKFREAGSIVAIGGIHATVMPEEAMSYADSVVIGEGEVAWPELINDFRNGTLKKYYRSPHFFDLTKAPIPMYELSKKYNYKMVWLQTSRGCPRDCEFCAASRVYGKAYRHKTVDQVIAEIVKIKGIWSRAVINFADDNMFIVRPYAYELLTKLCDLNIKWTALTDVSVADDDKLLDLLQRSGCVLLFIGFETLSEKGRIDRSGWKQKMISKYPEIINKIQSRGIGIYGGFLLGLDEDAPSVVEDISNFIIDNKLYASQVTVLTPLPGTKLRERLLQENRIISNDWRRYTFADVNFLPKNKTPDELQSEMLTIYKKTYNAEVRLKVVEHFKGIYRNLYEKKELNVNSNVL